MYPVTIYTLGCKLNQLEGEAIAGAFRKAGFPLVPWGTAIEGPGLVIINTCTVTSRADQKARRVIRQSLRENPQACVIVTGCYARLESGAIMEMEDSTGNRRLFVPGVNNAADAGGAKSSLLALPEYLLAQTRHVAQGDALPLLPRLLQAWADAEKGDSPFGFMPGDFVFHSRGYLKIQDGCNNNCSYCRTRFARGLSVSLPPRTALDHLRSLEANGCAELMITGVNITQYSYSGYDLASFLRFLLEGSSSIALRLSSLEPESITEELVSVLAHPRIRPHFHLSVQSGSDSILRAMYRDYTSQTVENAAALLRSVRDNPFLACDIIAGFPGESEADFAQTVTLCEKIAFAWIHAFPYSPRPGTEAANFPNPVGEREKAGRVALLTKMAAQGRRDYARGWLGREFSAVAEKGPCPAGQCRAVSENYLKLLVRCPGDTPTPGSSLYCVPVSPGAGDDGESIDLLANLVIR